MPSDSTYTLVLLRHGESEWNAKNLFTGWVDVDLSDKGVAEAERGGRLLARGRRAARRPAHLGAAAGDPHRAARARRVRPALDPGAPVVAAERAPLRRAAGQGQEGRRWRSTARSSSCSGAARTTSRRRRSTTPTSSARPRDPRYAALPPELRPRTECLADVVDRMLPYWYDAIVPDLRTGGDRPGHRARQLAARPGQAPRRHLGRGHRRAQHPDRHPARLHAGRRPACRPSAAGSTSTRTQPLTRSPPSPPKAPLTDGRTTVSSFRARRTSCRSS